MLMKCIPFVCLLSVVACGPSDAPVERKLIRTEHIPHLGDVVREDIERHRVGVRDAAKRLSRGFLLEDHEVRERQMRIALKRIQEPPKGVGAFVASPMSFLAAIDSQGIVIARDADPDPMKGRNFKDSQPLVAAALRGEEGHGIVEFEPLEEGADPSVALVFVAPVKHDGGVSGVVMAGIPLWRMAQRLSRQLRAEQAEEINEGRIVWVYLYRHAALHHFGTPPELDEKMPTASALQKMLKDHPQGFTDKLQLYQRWYGLGTAPIPSLGEGTGVVVVRANAVE